MNTILLPKLRYQTTVYAISNRDYIQIQKIYEAQQLSKMGFNGHWPIALRYGTHNMGSINLPSLYLEQTISQVNIVIKMLQTPSMEGLIKATLDMFQLQSGQGRDILQYPKKIEYTDSTWIQTLVNAMTYFRISIHRPDTYQFQPQRRNDTTIMDLVQQYNYTNTNLRHINTYRQYLKVIYVSDITTPDGNILPRI